MPACGRFPGNWPIAWSCETLQMVFLIVHCLENESRMPSGDVPHSVVLILSAFGSGEAAELCGRHLIEAGLAACVQVEGPIRSIYRWQGNLETADEFRLVAKTSPLCQAACQTAIEANHPYDLPEIVSLPATASRAYAQWVAEQTEQKPPS